MKISHLYIFCFLLAFAGCRSEKKPPVQKTNVKELPDKFLVLLGIAQDAGYPQAGCEKECCKAYWEGNEEKKLVTCLALVDRSANKYWLFEATPDITLQIKNVQQYIAAAPDYSPDGIFISHAHIGHYTGLMQLGREVMGAKEIPVWAMPRMDSFLRNNGPWSQLVSLKNIQLQQLKEDSTAELSSSFKVTPIRVPHRDEFSETAGFIIQSDKKKVLFIPDIDKWEKWDRDIVEQVRNVDVALLDGTFYSNGELPGRDMSEVPHPFVEESLQRFSSLSSAERSKILFIHFNHTNPLLKKKSAEKEKLKNAGFGVAEEGMIIEL
ncbi:MAG: MBL fold metallo-hydrolase [Bacteroidota bacterium]